MSCTVPIMTTRPVGRRRSMHRCAWTAGALVALALTATACGSSSNPEARSASGSTTEPEVLDVSVEVSLEPPATEPEVVTTDAPAASVAPTTPPTPAPTVAATSAPATLPPTTLAPATTEATVATEPPATLPPVTEPPVTAPPATAPPATSPPPPTAPPATTPPGLVVNGIALAPCISVDHFQVGADTRPPRGQVALYQYTLQSLGYSPGTIDGYFGQVTMEAAAYEILDHSSDSGRELFLDDGAVAGPVFSRLRIAC
jgi:hypothetical protein